MNGVIDHPCSCAAARAALWPPERPRLVGADIEEATRHVEECVSCSAFFALDRRILPAVEALREVRAPLDVRERVFDALAEVRAGRGGTAAAPVRSSLPPRSPAAARGILAASALVAALVAVVVTPAVIPTPARSAGTEALVVDDYLRRAVGAEQRVTADGGEVRAFLARELGVRFAPITVEGLILEGVEICLLDGRRSGLIHYRFQGVAISHYVVPTEEGDRSEPVVSARASAGSAEGLPVVTWSIPGLDQALMGDVQADALLRLAAAS